MVKDIIEGYAIIFFIIVLGTIAGGIIKAIFGYISIVLSNIVILITSKVLYNIIIIIK